MNCPRKWIALFLAAILAGGATGISRAQSPSSQGGGQPPSLRNPQEDTRGKIISRVSLVIVPVTVKDSNGELVTDLQQNDFRIFEDGIEQPISLFSVEAFPLSAAILIDDDLRIPQLRKTQRLQFGKNNFTHGRQLFRLAHAHRLRTHTLEGGFNPGFSGLRNRHFNIQKSAVSQLKHIQEPVE